MSSYFLSSFVKFCSVVPEEKSILSQPTRGKGGHLGFPISPKTINLVDDIVLLPDKFHLIPFKGFRREVENVSANQNSGCHLGFLIGPKRQIW